MVLMRIKSLFFMVFILAATPNMFAEEYGTGDTVEITASNLNVRGAASIDSEVLITVHKGEKVIVQDTVGEWLKVSFGEHIGFINSDYTIKVVEEGFYEWFINGWIYGGLILFTLFFGIQVLTARLRDKRFSGGTRQDVVPGGQLIKSMLGAVVFGLMAGIGYAIYMWFRN